MVQQPTEDSSPERVCLGAMSVFPGSARPSRGRRSRDPQYIYIYIYKLKYKEVPHTPNNCLASENKTNSYINYSMLGFFVCPCGVSFFSWNTGPTTRRASPARKTPGFPRPQRHPAAGRSRIPDPRSRKPPAVQPVRWNKHRNRLNTTPSSLSHSMSFPKNKTKHTHTKKEQKREETTN